MLTDGAAAQYGTDAIAGVINIILKKELKGLTWMLSTGQSAERDAEQNKFSLSGGLGEPGDKSWSGVYNLEVSSNARLENRDHRIRPDMEGGGLMDVGCYAVNAARLAFGVEPEEVVAFQRMSDKFEVDMSFAGVLRFPGGRLAIIDGGFESMGSQFYEIAGTSASVRGSKPR